MKPSKPFNPWPISIAGLGLFFISLTAWSIHQAQSGVSAVTDPTYYSHGLKFQETTVERRAAEGSGWQLRTELTGRLVSMQLTVGDRKSVTGASGELRLLATAAGQNHSIQLQETSAGRYQTHLPEDLQGTIPASVHFQRDGALLDRRLQLNLAAGEQQ